MNQQIKKIGSVLFYSLKTEHVFRLQFYLTIVLIWFQCLIYYLLFSGMFQGNQNISPLELTAYYGLVGVTSLTVSPAMYVAYEHMQKINTGEIIMDIMRPMSLVAQYFFQKLAIMLKHLLAYLPLFVLVHVFILRGVVWHSLLSGILSIILGFGILYEIQGIIGCFAVRFHDITRVRDVIYTLLLILGGRLIPSSYLFGGLKRIVYFTPLPYVYDVPVSLLLQQRDSSFLLYQFIWFSVLGIVYWLLLQKYVVHEIEYGG